MKLRLTSWTRLRRQRLEARGRRLAPRLGRAVGFLLGRVETYILAGVALMGAGTGAAVSPGIGAIVAGAALFFVGFYLLTPPRHRPEDD